MHYQYFDFLFVTKQSKQATIIRLHQFYYMMSKARGLLLCGDIKADDYQMIKSDADKKIIRLETKLTSTITDAQNAEPCETRQSTIFHSWVIFIKQVPLSKKEKSLVRSFLKI